MTQHDSPFMFGSWSIRYTLTAMRPAAPVAMGQVTIHRMSAWLFVVLLLGGRSAAAQRPPDLAITGVVVDATGGALPRAAVQLTDAAGATVQSLVTDSAGGFRLERV